MEIIKYEDLTSISEAIKNNEPLLAVISFDGNTAIVSHVDEAVEHHILLAKAGIRQTDIDKYFRIIFDKDGADWTFVCPADYKGITDKQRRIAQFYKDGFASISSFLSDMGFLVDINIPKRYNRHIQALYE